ncbi:response regulator [Flavobacterium panacagri]|uniref:response regulator n=1 Tax=Flavobacterium panacagri TaxID=3034146 RepID=UPI0025A556C1|nr:response regulator [Flavobacterium panacagri]
MSKNDYSKKIICLADKDDDDRMMLHEALLELNAYFEIFEVCSGEQLMDQFLKQESGVPDFIFLELCMPFTDGFGVIGSVRKILPAGKTRIVVYSSESSTSSIDQAFMAGADFYAVKPSNYADLKKLSRIIMEARWDSLGCEQRIFHIR